MEPKFQTSFIPKKPIVSSSSSAVKVIHSSNISATIATVVFLLVVLTSGALFAYKTILTNQIDQASKDVASARAAFEPEVIKNLLDANSRISASESLLNSHVLVSKALLFFQQVTLKKMRFTDFSYVYKDNQPTVTITGEVQTYNALADQQDTFSKNEFIKDPKFSGFKLENNGYVGISFSATLDPNLLSYKKAIESTSLNQ